MKQSGKITLGALVVIVAMGLAYAEVKADAALISDLESATPSSEVQTHQFD